MKKHFSRVLAMVLVLVTLVATFAVPASAAGYYMACSIYYKDEAGNQVASTKTFSMNAADTTAQTLCISSGESPQEVQVRPTSVRVRSIPAEWLTRQTVRITPPSMPFSHRVSVAHRPLTLTLSRVRLQAITPLLPHLPQSREVQLGICGYMRTALSS